MPILYDVGGCMDDRLHILVADYVPIANKGEEAIVRGIEDMLSDGRPVALGLFDNVLHLTQWDNLTIFPRDWLFRFEGNSHLSARGRILSQAIIALQLRLGIYGPLQNLTSVKRVCEKRHAQRAHGSLWHGHPADAAWAGCPCHEEPLSPTQTPLADFFERAEYVLVGHDGVFCVESCGILHLAKQQGKRAGILGASTGIGSGRLYKAWLYRRAMEESDFCLFREEHSCASMKQVCRDPDKLHVAPDPAFALRPAPPEAVQEVLGACESYGQAKRQARPVVAVTVLEKGRVYAGFRPDLQGRAKQEAHAQYLAAILDALIARHHVFALFLPHSLEADGNDIMAARHVIEQMKTTPADTAILEQDCGPRLLKSIIRACDFLVGERTHSLIGSISVGTPFAALTNRQDTRTHGIVGAMCRCEGQIIDMDSAGAEEAGRKIERLFASREAMRKSLGPLQEELSREIEEMVRTIKGEQVAPREVRAGQSEAERWGSRSAPQVGRGVQRNRDTQTDHRTGDQA